PIRAPGRNRPNVKGRKHLCPIPLSTRADTYHKTPNQNPNDHRRARWSPPVNRKRIGRSPNVFGAPPPPAGWPSPPAVGVATGDYSPGPSPTSWWSVGWPTTWSHEPEQWPT